MVEILPAKVSRRCPYQVTILGTTVVYPHLYGSENHVRYLVLLKIVTWYGHLRDTFAGKILITFQKYFPLPENLKRFYRQKCRAGVRTKLLFLVTRMSFISHGFPSVYLWSYAVIY